MDNNSTYTNDTSDWTTGPTASPTRITLYSILLVWSLLGNVLVIAVVFGNKNLRTNMNYLIVNMAVSDLLIPLIALPLRIIDETSERPNEWLVDGPLGNALCKLSYFVVDISPTVSSLSLVIIAVNRFIAVAHPSRRKILSRKTRWILVSFPWITAMAYHSPYFYTFRLTNKWGYPACIASWSPAFDTLSAHMIFISIMFVVVFVIPVMSNIVLYSIIHYKLKQNLKNVIGLIERRTIRSRQQTNKRIFFMSTTIIVTFTICWCPISVVSVLFDMDWLRSLDWYTYDYIYFAVFYLLYLQTAINPCIYFVFLRDYRQGLKRLFCRKPSPQQNPQISKPCVYCSPRRTRTRGGDSNQDPTCTTRHVNYTTTV